MKYFVRSIKYFLQFSLIFIAVMVVLVLTGMAEGNIDTMFRGGWNAVWQIAVLFAFVAAVYPRFGFVKMPIDAPEGTTADVEFLKTCMAVFDYIPENQDDTKATFRKKTFGGKLSRMFEDRITFIKTPTGWQAEGLRKDVMRTVSLILHRMNPS